jgi:hypothetical protein
MRRSLTFAALAALIATASLLYLVEHEVQGLERRLHRLNAELLDSQHAIQVLKAEWSYLNQPDRLQELASRHADRLQLAPLEPAQIVTTLADLPVRERSAPASGEAAAPQADATPRPAFKPARPARPAPPPSPEVVLARGGQST